MFRSPHYHHQGGCVPGNTDTANSVEGVLVWGWNTMLSFKIAKKFKILLKYY